MVIIIRKHGMKGTIVSNKYTNSLTAKLQELEQRATNRPSHTILFDENTVCIGQETKFLANSQCKNRLVKAFKTKMIEGDLTLSLRKKTLPL